jgi:hypothetical protein
MSTSHDVFVYAASTFLFLGKIAGPSDDPMSPYVIKQVSQVSHLNEFSGHAHPSTHPCAKTPVPAEAQKHDGVTMVKGVAWPIGF